jgi:hypothetical protein
VALKTIVGQNRPDIAVEIDDSIVRTDLTQFCDQSQSEETGQRKAHKAGHGRHPQEGGKRGCRHYSSRTGRA